MPRCVESCPAAALQFGDIEELRKRHATGWVELEALYGMPDPTISGPSIVVVSREK
ncbi:Anaerobic dimethyl sulfoxide reductase chain B [compost metagenome]